MPNAFENLPKAAFDGIEFPILSVRVRGGMRHHVHEYPHIPGGDPEKLGRRLYEIEMVGNFQAPGGNTPGQAQLSVSKGFAAYDGGVHGRLWPNRLYALRTRFEAGDTAKLMIPTIGAIDAFCVEWDQEQSNKMLSGETATFKFIEDQELAFLVDNLLTIDLKSLDSRSKFFKLEADKAGIDISLSDQIVNAVNAVLAIQDTADAYGALLAAKIGMVAALCREFDQRINSFLNPQNHPALDAMKDLWAASDQLANTLSGNQPDAIAVYVVKKPSTISDVAVAIYGNTERAVELLQLNPIEDAFNIPAGTRVKYLVEQTSLRAA